MTCGICDPETMAQCYGADGKKSQVFGYVVPLQGRSLEDEVARLYFLGASVVFWDECWVHGTHLNQRAKMKRLLRVLRAGDVLLINDPKSIGDRYARQVSFWNKLIEGEINPIMVARPDACTDFCSFYAGVAA